VERFIAWYAVANDCRPKLMHVNRCGLCGGDPITRALHKDYTSQLVAMGSLRS
jgi:hypothetical protein